MSAPRNDDHVDPMQQKRYPLFHVRGSILDDIWRGWVFSVAWTVMVTVVYKMTSVSWAISPLLITVMSTVVSLMLVFRTNTAYDRFWEGRRVWGQTTTAIRNLARLIWINVKETEPIHVVEKKSAINLLVAFAVATKHYLREQYAHNYDDLYTLISHLPKYRVAFQPAEKTYDPHHTKHVKRVVHHISAFARRTGKKESPYLDEDPALRGVPRLDTDLVDNTQATPTNIPVDLTVALGAYVSTMRGQDRIDLPTTTNMLAALNTLVECLTNFERIRRTPVPAAYSIHLSQIIWLYILTLPFQCVQTFGYITILIVGISSFTLLGIEAIGQEIENPFGYDANDLPLDDFCEAIEHEIDSLTARPPPSTDEWTVTSVTHPFGGFPSKSVDLRKASMDEVRSLLSVKSVRSARNKRSDEPKPVEVEEPKKPDPVLVGDKKGHLRVEVESAE